MTKKVKHPLNSGKSLVGLTRLKDGNDDDRQKDEGLEVLTKEISGFKDVAEKASQGFADTNKALTELKETVAQKDAVDAETQAKLTAMGEDMAKQFEAFQNASNAIDQLKKDMDQPIFQNKKDLEDSDRATAIELQKRIVMHKKDIEPHEFEADMDNLVDMKHFRSAVRKMMKGGLETKHDIMRSFTVDEKKAFDAASLDSAFFMPEMLGMEVDCEIECAQIWDLYNQESVSRSSFMYPHVQSYGNIGKYDCDAKCDAEFGPEGNIVWDNGRTYDWRGVFCFNRDVLREANYDLLGFMMRAAARAYRINRNDAMIRGDGLNEPLGWLNANPGFTKVASPFLNPNHQDLRQFLASAPVEYGRTVSVMHQNTFAYFAAMVDNNGRFIFGDGLMGFGPEDVRDRIRISNCLDDPTEGGTKGSTASPFDAGAFIMATGVWDQAYTAVSHRPMFMEQFIGGSTAWCVQYQFGAKDGGFVTCAPAARIMQAGAVAAP